MLVVLKRQKDRNMPFTNGYRKPRQKAAKVGARNMMYIFCIGRRMSFELWEALSLCFHSTPLSTPPISSRPTSASVVLSHTGSFSIVFAKLTSPPLTPMSSRILSISPETLSMPTSVISAPRMITIAFAAVLRPPFALLFIRISPL